MLVKIKRQENATSKPYWEEYEIAANGKITVSHIIESINYYWDNKLSDADINEVFNDNSKAINLFAQITKFSGDKPFRRINWEHGCMQNMCGACAMVVNHQPAMACSTYIDTNTQKLLTIEPLSKFDVIEDLVVDRSIVRKHALDARLYIDKVKVNKKLEADQYMASKCMKCGLCLEVCPKYNKEEDFFGGTFAVESYLCYSRSENKSEKIANVYKDNFAAHCSKSGACQNVCPQKIPVLAQISQMNRNV